MGKVIKANFDQLSGNEITTESRYQYDYGMILKFGGAVTLPQAYEVHFALDKTGDAVTQIGGADGVTVPDSMFTSGAPIYAWVYLHDSETDGYTQYTAIIPVIKRAAPSDLEPTPVQQSAIDQAIAALGVAVEQTAADVEATAANAENAQASAEAAANSAAEAAETAEGVETNVTAAQAAKAAAESARDRAVQAETAAASSETNAAASATAAGLSKTAAQTAETGAQASATAAANSASAALTSEENANGAMMSAYSDANRAETAATTATNAKTDAVSAKNAAVSAKTAAETAAGTATTKATAAANSATAAANSATAAAGSATEAATTAQGISEHLDQIDENTDAIEGLKEDLSTINSEGTVPTSEQMLSGNYTEDSAPYHFRKTASDNADREELEIVGGSVAWNQLVQTTSTSVTVTSGHKYYANINGIKTIGASTGTAISINDGTKDNVVDLTQALGSTIADHIYSLEQSTAGAGVALFKQMFPKDYYAYDAGSMQSVSGLQSHKTVGFNAWDEEWEAYSANQIRGKNKIKLISGATYYAKTPSMGVILYFKAQESDSANVGQVAVINNTFVVPANANYAVLYTNVNYGTTYKNDICINLSDLAKNGTYEPYDGHSYPLNPNGDLRGIFKIDSNGNLYADGDIYNEDGTVRRRFGIVDLGTLNWTRVEFAEGSESAYVFYTADIGIKKGYNNGNLAPMICSKYLTVSYYVASSTYKDLLDTDKSIAFGYNSGNRLNVRDDSYTDAATFKTAMSGVYLVYEKDTPTTEQADPYIGIQSCDPNGTEEFVSTGSVPVGHNTKYPDNMRAKLDGLPWNFASLIAPTESGYTATRNYTTGQLLIVNNVLYKATANIANGGTITPNTNVTATTLAEVISALS